MARAVVLKVQRWIKPLHSSHFIRHCGGIIMNAYRIGVMLSMSSNGPQVLGALANGFLGLNRHIGAAQAGLRSVQTALVALSGIIAGGALIGGTLHLIRAGNELVHQQVLLLGAGEDNLAVARATTTAWQTTARVMGTTVSQNMRALGELRGLLGSLSEAEQVLPAFQRLGRVLGIVTGQGTERGNDYATRFLDLRGAIQFGPDGHLNQGRFSAEMDALQRATITNRGRVSPQALFGFMQQAGPAGALLSNRSLYADMSVLIESMGGHRSGTALAAISRQLTGGIMTQRVASEMQRYGLINRGGVEVRRGGHVVVRPGAVRNGSEFQSDPVAWIRGTLLPGLQARGVTTQQDQLQAIFRLFGTETARRFVTQILLSQQQIDRERVNQANVPANAADILISQSPLAAMENFQAAINNLLTALGAPMVPTATAALNYLATSINSLALAASEHPDAIQVIGGIAVALGGLLATVGTLALARVSFSALSMLFGASGIGGMLTAMAGVSASAMGMLFGASGLTGLLSGLGGLAAALAASPVVIGAALVAVAGGIAMLGMRLSGYSWEEAFNNLMNPLQRFYNWITGLVPNGAGTGGDPATQTERQRNWGGRGGGGGFYEPQSFVPPPAANSPSIQGAVYMDRRVVGQIVAEELGRIGNGVRSGIARFDERRGYSPVEMGAA
jgi:hypothetical protein